MLKDEQYKAFERQVHRMDSCLELAYCYHERDRKLSEYYVRLAQEYFEEVAGAIHRNFDVMEAEKKRGIFVS
jgi:hypothetical protein